MEASAPEPDHNVPSTDSNDPTIDGVTAHTTTPDKTVFVESGNHDAWIATDYVVECRR